MISCNITDWDGQVKEQLWAKTLMALTDCKARHKPVVSSVVKFEGSDRSLLEYCVHPVLDGKDGLH